jgi:hypothetical protein
LLASGDIEFLKDVSEVCLHRALCDEQALRDLAVRPPLCGKQLRHSAAHADAMRRFWGPDLAIGGQTGVWTVDHLNGRMVRCGDCGAMVPAAEICRCGAPLPAAPTWW